MTPSTSPKVQGSSSPKEVYWLQRDGRMWAAESQGREVEILQPTQGGRKKKSLEQPIIAATGSDGRWRRSIKGVRSPNGRKSKPNPVFCGHSYFKGNLSVRRREKHITEKSRKGQLKSKKNSQEPGEHKSSKNRWAQEKKNASTGRGTGSGRAKGHTNRERQLTAGENAAAPAKHLEKNSQKNREKSILSQNGSRSAGTAKNSACRKTKSRKQRITV